MERQPCQPKCVVGSLELAHFGNEYICKRPSDDGPYVFVDKREEPRSLEHFVIEVNRGNKRGNARHGKVLWSTRDVSEELARLVKGAEWLRDRNGDPWVRGLKASVGEFDAYLVPEGYSTTYGVWPACIVFEPVANSRYRELKYHLRNWLESGDEAEIERAETAPFAPGVTPAPGKPQMIADMLARRSSSQL